MPNKPLISAVINVKNEAAVLPRCLKSLRGFTQELIVVDMQSTDNSVEIARDYGAKVFQYRPLEIVEPARNFALSKATGKWIILLDPDEYLTKTLKNELLRITQERHIDYVKIPRKNIIFNKWIRHSNFWPDYLIRFFKKGSVTWKPEVHSQPKTVGTAYTLIDSEKLAIKHINYTNVTDFILKTIRYSNTQAGELFTSGYKLKTSDFLLRPIQEFNSRFFAAEGYRDGLHGLIIAILQAFSVTLSYIYLWEKQGFSRKALSKESFVSASLEASYEYGHWFTKYFTEECTSNIFKKVTIRLRQLFERLVKNF